MFDATLTSVIDLLIGNSMERNVRSQSPLRDDHLTGSRTSVDELPVARTPNGQVKDAVMIVVGTNGLISSQPKLGNDIPSATKAVEIALRLTNEPVSIC